MSNKDIRDATAVKYHGCPTDLRLYDLSSIGEEGFALYDPQTNGHVWIPQIKGKLGVAIRQLRNWSDFKRNPQNYTLEAYSKPAVAAKKV